MPRYLVAAALLLIPALARAQAPRELVGKYQREVEGGDVLELRADGSAALAGEETRWAAQGDRLTIGPDTMQYQLGHGRLLLVMGSVQISWKRLGPAPKAASPMQKAAARAQAAQAKDGDAEAQRPPAGVPPQAGAGAPGAAAQDAQARQILLSSAWCSFTYSQVSGTSTTRKVVFRPDGVMTVNGGAETYSSGAAGSYAGQSATSGAMRWKLESLRLYIDQGDGAGFQDVGLTAERNSNGYPILHAGGREYSMCN